MFDARAKLATKNWIATKSVTNRSGLLNYVVAWIVFKVIIKENFSWLEKLRNGIEQSNTFKVFLVHKFCTFCSDWSIKSSIIDHGYFFMQLQCLHAWSRLFVRNNSLKVAGTSFLARGVDHHRASRVSNTHDRGARFKTRKTKQIWRRAAFFAQGHFCSIGGRIRI